MLTLAENFPLSLWLPPNCTPGPIYVEESGVVLHSRNHFQKFSVIYHQQFLGNWPLSSYDIHTWVFRHNSIHTWHIDRSEKDYSKK